MLQDPETCARIVLVRHPEIEDPERQQALGQRDAVLSRRGRQQTIEVLRSISSLTVDRVLSSPAKHCVETAEAISRDRGLTAEVRPELRGQCLGDWEGKAWAQLSDEHPTLVRDFFRDYGKFAPPGAGGETLSDAVDRLLGYWAEIVDDLEAKTVLMIADAPMLGAFASRLLGLGLGRAPALGLPPASLAILDVFRDGAALRSWHPNALREDMP